MKFHNTFTLGVVALGIAGSALAQNTQAVAEAAAASAVPPVAAAAAAAPVAPFSDLQVIEGVGWLLGRNNGLNNFNFTPEQFQALVKGLQLSATDQDLPYDKAQIGPMIMAYIQGKEAEFQAKRQAQAAEMKKASVAEAAAFFTKLKENKAVVELPSGLHYEIVQPGTGATPKATDNVVVHYTGKLINGSVFDSSVERNEPAELRLDQVIPGWTEGIQKIAVGGKIRLYIPGNLAYGDEGRLPKIPPGATLVFDVELLEIKAPAPAPAAAVAPAQPAAPVAQ